MPRIGADASGCRSAPGQQQAGDIRQVVSGIGEQCQRTGVPAVKRLDDNKDNIQRDAQREGAIEGGRRMRVTVRMFTVMMRVAVRFVVVGGGHGVSPRASPTAESPRRSAQCSARR